MIKKILFKLLRLIYGSSGNDTFFKLFNLNKIKFNVGSGKIGFIDEWFNTDKNTLDITQIEDWKKYLKFLKVDNVFAEHVWEHLTPEQADAGNKNIYHCLKSGGRLRIAVPDGYNPSPEYINHVKPGGIGPGADDHKLLYNYKMIQSSLEKVGFKVEFLEYWDEQGKFHFTDWDIKHGKVIRSRRFDSRNEGGKLGYTSLIVDAIKP